MDKLVVIDGNSLINRAFYALPALTNSAGEYSNAVFGFTNMLLKVIQENNPKYIAVAFDHARKTFRNDIYADYKGTRKPTPVELVGQFPILKELLTKMNITIIEQEGIEADDIIGCLTKSFNIPSIILTGDKDSLQLISNRTEVWLTKKGISEIKLMNEKTLMEEYGLQPYQIIELKALMGDSSDNIPGVKGVGEKTALDLLHQYNNIDELYANIDNIKGKLQEKLIADRDMAYLSKTLATIKCNQKLNVKLEDLTYDFPFNAEVLDIFKKYNFNSLIKRIELFKNVVKPESTDKNNDDNTNNINLIKVTNVKEIENLIGHIKRAGNFNFEINKSFNFCFDKNCEYFMDLNGDLINGVIDFSQVLQTLKPVFEDEDIKKIVFDCKEQKHILIKEGISLNGIVFDCCLANYLITCGERPKTKQEILENFGCSWQYCATSLFNLKNILAQKLHIFGLKELYYNVEFPLIEVLFDMEQVGFKIDYDELVALLTRYTSELDDLKKVICNLAGEDFNLNSPKQLGAVLFDKLGLSVYNNKKQSTGIDILEELAGTHPIIELIIRYRKIQKIVSTYLEPFKILAQQNNNIIHTIFNQTLTATGRLSSSEPNLQNIPIRDDEGKYLRKIFIPSSSSGWLVSADYSQIELRLLACFSKDPNLVDAFKTGKDVHTQTASEVFGVPFADVTSFQRRNAKAVNFGIIYGISDYGLAQNIGCTRKEAKDYIETYFQKYPSVKNYMDENVKFAKENGYIKTLLNRRRVIPELLSPNFNIRSFGARVAMNMPLQGSASDIIKVAMNKVFNALKQNNLKSKLILQIHDELIIDTDEKELSIVTKILKDSMENAVQLVIPLTVDANAGKNWFECK